MQANPTSGPSLTKAIGIIVGSTRPACNGRPIASWVHKIVLQHCAGSSSNTCCYELVDLSQWNLPLFDEPGVPARNPPVHEHTKAWQAKVKTFDGFVFVSPQYNWGYPAALKNAIDYLYHEWLGKPAVVITYGTRGGGKAAAQLQQVLSGLRMKVMPKMPAMALSESLLIGGLAKAEEGGTTELCVYLDDILAAVGQLEEALIAG
ncbi:TPA: hypothetical protein ACH3X2_004731 [Trebouxia sp. C0005]